MKTYTCDVLDADDGSGDTVLQLPPELCIEEDWREGDSIKFTSENGSIVMRNISKEERESISK